MVEVIEKACNGMSKPVEGWRVGEAYFLTKKLADEAEKESGEIAQEVTLWMPNG